MSPDFSYWLSLEGLNSNYISVDIHTHVVFQRMMCPYFTVAITSKNQDLKSAEIQIMTFGATALYNRYRLARKAVDKDKAVDKNKAIDDNQIRHYALILDKSAFYFWCFRPTIDAGSEWKGCTMELLFGSDLTLEKGVGIFLNWMNEIHRWGLTDHLETCLKDLHILLGLDPAPLFFEVEKERKAWRRLSMENE